MTKKPIVAGLLAAVFLFASAPANAALMAYLEMTGTKQGQVKGSITQKGRENMIGIIAAEQSSSSPFDMASGMGRGANVNGPLTITKELDQATPILRKMMASNEVTTKFELRFWGPSLKATPGGAADVQQFTISLKNARIIGYHFHMANIRNTELAKLPEYEEVSFAYESITYTWNEGGITFSDTWVSAGR